ncbi:MAG TPA: SgcJ/EcaC family oxidoreductase [Gemmatimonadaceae bacterium]|nr:SgcJ/EcaC family oxidoreductase [Gemmatimonadaceae bacterium]
MGTILVQSADPAEAVLDVILEENEGWNQGDVELYSRSIADNVTFTNIRGQHFMGRDAFVKQHDVIFGTFFKGTKLEQKVVSLQFVGTDVALLDTLASLSGIPSPLPYMRLDAQGRLTTRLLQVLVKQDDEWKVVAYHNVDIKG